MAAAASRIAKAAAKTAAAAESLELADDAAGLAPRLKKVKKELTEEQRAKETAKRGQRRRRLKQDRLDAAARAAAEEKGDDDNADLVTKTATAALLLIGLTPSAAAVGVATAAAVGVSSTAASSNASTARPPRSKPLATAPSPAHGFVPGTMPPRVSPTSDESGEVPALVLNPPATPLVAQSPAPQTAEARAAAPPVVAPARNLFGTVPTPSPGDPRYYEEDDDPYYGEDVLQDMVCDNTQYDGDDYNAGDDETLPTGPDVINIDNEPVFNELDAAAAAMRKKVSQRGASFTTAEDILICESWIEVGTNQIIGAEQKGSAFWGRFTKRYNEGRILPPRNILTHRTECSISKRWNHIQEQMSKFCGAVEHIESRPPQSGYGIKEQMLQALDLFKAQYGKVFTLTHCYRELKDQEKWKELYASLKKAGQAGHLGVDKGEGTTEKEKDGRPRGKNNSKAEQKRDATTLALQETLSGFLSQKDKTCDKREERREKERLEREAASKLYFELQKKRLDIEEENARTRAAEVEIRGKEAEARTKEADVKAREVELKAKDLELALRAEEARIMDMDISTFTPRKKAYYEKKQRQYMDQV
jgi:hypothetical protein